MSENHFQSHFWPFQINTKLFFGEILILFFYKMAGSHFGSPKITFGSHFWPFQIDTQLFFKLFLTKWLSSAILDVRNSLSITFLAISDQYEIFFLKFLTKWLLDVRNLPSIAFLAILDQYRFIFYF